MKRSAIILITVMVFLSGAAAQTQPYAGNDILTESQGDFPSDLRKALNTKKSDKAYSRFLVEMLRQGKIVYGTEMNAYLDSIAGRLLVGHPQLQQAVHVYLLQTTAVNAYSMQNGIILVSMGMMAQVTNEAELAFVLAHEIAHYSERHGLDGDKSQKGDVVSRYMRYHHHSREQEFDADRVGLTTFFKETPYSYDIIDGIFDVLLYSDLPFDELPYKRSEVETDFYRFPDKYYLNTVSNIADRSRLLDTLLTHPSIDKRRTVAKGIVRNFPNDGRRRFVQPEEQFLRLRNAARLSCVELYLVKHQYDKAIYNIFVLRQQNPDNEYLKRAEVTAWYGAAKHKIYSQGSSYMENYRTVEGERQQLNHLLTRMNRNEYAVLALRKAWAAMRENPKDEYFSEVVNDLVADIFVKQKMRYNDFCDYPQGTTLDEIAETGEDTTRHDSKYDRIKQQNRKVLPEERFRTVNYMLADIHSDSLFRAIVNDVVVNAEMKSVLNAVSEGNIGNERSLFVVTPTYHIYDGNGYIADMEKDKRNAERLQRMMCHTIKRMGVTPETFTMDFRKPETWQYNNHVKMSLWYEDFTMGHASGMRQHTSGYIEGIAESLGCGKLCYVRVSDAPGAGFFANKATTPWLIPLFPYTAPVVLGVLCLQPHDVNVDFRVSDIATGQTEVASHYTQSQVMRKAYINGFVYRMIEKYIKHNN